MTSHTENSNFEMKLTDLQKKFGEEKRAHGETILQLLSAQDQAQTAEAEAAKAQELVSETTLKLDQAREEIKGLRAQAQEAQAKIKDMEAQLVQMRLSEQSQAQTAIEAQEEVRSLRAQTQELDTARAKIASLEARMVKARAFFAEFEVETNSDPRDQAEEFKAKIESLEIQMAQMKVVDQFQAQAQELSAARAKITELEAEIAQSEKQAQEEILLMNSEIQDLRAKTQELEAAQAKITDLEAQIAQIRLSEQSQAQNAVEAQEEVRNLTFQVQYERVKARKIDTANAFGRETRAQVLQETNAMLTGLEAQVPKPSSVQVSELSEWYSPSWQSCDQLFRIEQNDCRVWFKSPGSPNTHLFCKFVSDKTVILSLAAFGTQLKCWFRFHISDGQRWTTIGHLGPENPKMPIWKWMLRRAPSRINAFRNKEYKLVICCERLPGDPTISS
ncbi:unnamed protein product [Caenorhabditis brenneri]